MLIISGIPSIEDYFLQKEQHLTSPSLCFKRLFKELDSKTKGGEFSTLIQRKNALTKLRQEQYLVIRKSKTKDADGEFDDLIFMGTRANTEIGRSNILRFTRQATVGVNNVEERLDEDEEKEWLLGKDVQHKKK